MTGDRIDKHMKKAEKKTKKSHTIDSDNENYMSWNFWLEGGKRDNFVKQ